MRDLVPWPGIKPGPSALGAWSLNHWATKEVPPFAAFEFIPIHKNTSIVPQYVQPHQIQVQFSRGLDFHQRLDWEKICFYTYMVVGGIQFLSGCQTEILNCLLAVGWRLPSFPCYMVLSLGKLTRQHLASLKPARESLSKTDVIILVSNHIHVTKYIPSPLLRSID